MPELPEDVSISIDGRRFWGWSDLSLSKGIDVFSQASFVVPFEPENEAFRRTFSPYSYRDIAIDVGGQRFFTGVMFVNPSRAVNNRQVKVEAYASPAVLQDAHMPASAFPLEFRGLNLQQIGEALCGPFGLSVAFEAESIPPSPAVLAAQRKRRRARRRLQDIQEQREALAKNLHMRPGSIARQAGEETLDQLETFTRAELSAVRVPYAPPSPDAPFRRVRVKPDERPFVVLAELAKQRNVVINDMPDGTLRFWQSAKAGEPVARFVEGLPPIGDVAPRFQPQAYYSEITGLAKTGATRNGARHTERNPFLRGVVRPYTFVADDTEANDLPAAVRAKMGRMFGNAVAFDIPVPTWRDAAGKLWDANKTVTLHAPGAMIYRETEFLIRTVTFKQSEKSRVASLELVLPGAFSGEIPERLPWD